MKIEIDKLEYEDLLKIKDKYFTIQEAIFRGDKFKVDSERKIIKIVSKEDRKVLRIERYMNHLKTLKSLCEKGKFTITDFLRINKADPEFMASVYKIGLVKNNGTSRKPIYIWIGGEPTKEDAKFCIDYINDRATDRRITLADYE